MFFSKGLFMVLLHYAFATKSGTSLRHGLQARRAKAEYSIGLTEASKAAAERDTRAVPDRLVFNHKSQLLEDVPPGSRTRLDEELGQNVKRTLSVYPDIHNVEFLDNTGCRAAIRMAHSEKLAAHFEKEKTGMYKSDVCRLAQLALHGGYYMDTDYQVLHDVRKTLPPRTSFASVIALPWMSTSPRKPNEMFQSFLAAAPRHPVIRSSLDKALDFYEGRNETLTKILGGRDTMGRNGTLHGTLLARLAYEEWLGQPMEPGLQEKPGDGKFKYSYMLEEQRLNPSQYPHVKPQSGGGNNCNIVTMDRPSDTVIAFSHSEAHSCQART